MPYNIKQGDGTDATVPDFNPNGRASAANSAPVVVSNEDRDLLGVTTSAAAADETANTGLNGLLKGIYGFIRARLPSLVSGAVPARLIDTVPIVSPSGLSVLNVDLLTGLSGTNGWVDVSAFQSGSIQIVASAGITAGAIFFEQTNDPSLASAGVPLRAVESGTINTNPNVAAITIAASTARVFKVQIDARYIRVRISTAFVGGTVQAIANFSQMSTAYPVVSAQQATAANLNVTATLGAGTAAAGQVSTGGIATNVGSLLAARITAAASGFAKNTAGRLYDWTLINTTASIRYLQIYNKASAGVPGTDTPVITIPIPPNGGAPSVGTSIGFANATGIAWAITTDAAGATIGTAGDVTGTLLYV